MLTRRLKKAEAKSLAEFVEEGLAGLGILDDADEILACYYEDDGAKGAKRAQKHYNNAIAFVNEVIPSRKLRPITDEDLSDWEFDK